MTDVWGELEKSAWWEGDVVACDRINAVIARGRALEKVVDAALQLVRRGDEMLPSPTDRANFVLLSEIPIIRTLTKVSLN